MQSKIKVVAVLLLIFITSPALAETWTLLPKLTVTAPESLDVTFQSSADIGIEGEHVWGWQGEEADYFVLPTEWETGLAGTLAWKVMVLDLKFDSEIEDLKSIEEDEFETDAGYEVEYKLISYGSEGDKTIQFFASIENANGAFMIIGTSFSGDEKYLLKSMKTLASSVRISK